MWTRLRVGAIRRVRETLLASGSARVSLPLALLVLAFLLANAWWTHEEGNVPLTGTWPWWTLAVAVAADGLVSVLRALPVRQRRDGSLELALLEPRHLGGLLLRGSWLFAALAFVGSTAARDRFLFRVAVGERFQATADQLVRREPLRSLSSGPFPVDLQVVGVRGGAWGGGGTVRAELRDADSASSALSALSPAWFGWDRYLRPCGSGVAIRYEVVSASGTVLDGAFSKLEPARVGRRHPIRPEGVPAQVMVEQPAISALVAGKPPRLRVAVYRGKLLVAEGEVAGGQPIAFDDLDLTFPEWRPWVELEMVRDPGIPLGAVAALLALAGGATVLLSRRSSSSGKGAAGEGGS